MVRPRDSQRQKVYDWETDEVFKKPENVVFRDLSAASEYVARLCRKYGVAVPPVLDGRGRRRPGVVGGLLGKPGISLPRHARSKAIVLHELAHWLRRGNTLSDRLKEAPHGPEFVRTYIELLAQEGLGTVRELTKSARAQHLKVAPPAVAPERKTWRDDLRAGLDKTIQQMAQKYQLPESQVRREARHILNKQPS